MPKRLTPRQRQKAKRLAEKLKGRRGINPFAVANAAVQRKKPKKRR